MPGEAGVDGVPASSRRSHSSQKKNVIEVDLGGVLQVVPVACVEVLSHQLNGWLGAVNFEGWHVKIVYEDHGSLRVRRSIVASF